MTLWDRLTVDMKAAMKAKDKVRLETVRALRGQIKNAQIEKGEELTDEEMLQVAASVAKKQRNTIAQFRELGQDDRAEEEMVELKVLESYLPKQMDEAEVAAIVADVIVSVGATSMKDMGKVMGAAMAQLKGKADGKVVQNIVKEKLAAL